MFSFLVSGIFYIILAVPTVYICSCQPQILSKRSRAYMHKKPYFVCFVCFVALRPKSTAMVIAGQSVHLTTLSPGQA